MGPATRLREQLSRIELLSARLLGERADAQHVLFGELVQRAVAYVDAHRHAVLPALQAQHWKALRSDFLVEAVQFQSKLADLLTLRPGAAGFASSIAAFHQRTVALAAAQRQVLFPAFEQLGLDRDTELDAYIQRAFSRYTAAGPFDVSAASRLVNEAAVVLSSLPGLQTRVGVRVAPAPNVRSVSTIVRTTEGAKSSHAAADKGSERPAAAPRDKEKP